MAIYVIRRCLKQDFQRISVRLGLSFGWALDGLIRGCIGGFRFGVVTQQCFVDFMAVVMVMF